ncbi:acetate--CoA ligase family protein [Hoeflea poritis]|uniref:Acetate--CoA ligase family protein n=1 Tax=Hoeflea poritis TaxID=2993659 RepID=A0ABT4VHA6_9HYPH|nr:acetate--CoA ligase family protein [Hoeflea poritis]MDA4844096.1 acetate--CoA ligase family protein [Hoeflea poritis]
MSQIQRLLRPRSIAVVGGGAWCEAVVTQNRKMGFAGDIWPVHPTRDTVGGLPAYAAIGALPGIPDAAFIGVNRHATIETVRALNAAGAGGAVCFASGFRETADGVDLQLELLEAAGDVTLLGPNCYGFVNYLDGALLWPDQHGGARVSRGAAIVTQSSNIAINLTMQKRSLPLAYVITAGNQAQIGLAEIGRALLEDSRVSVLGLHIEGIEDVRAFEALAASARKLGKPVVALKVGDSEHARAAALTHTASLAGHSAGATAFFRRLGMGQVNTLSEFLEALKLLHATGPLASRRIASMSCSGGEAALIADAAHRHGLEFPTLSAQQEARLRDLLGPLVTPANPLDYHTQIWRDEAALTETFCTMAEGTHALTLLVLDFPRGDRCDQSDWDRLVSATLAARDRAGRDFAVVSSLPENMPEDIANRLLSGGVVPLNGLEEACAAIRCAADAETKPEYAPVLTAPAPSSPRTLSEADAKAELARFGIAVPMAQSAKTPEEAAIVADELGFPVVLKGEGFAHKSEQGAVVLGLWTAAAVEDAAKNMSAERFLVEQQILGGVAELLIGIVRDDAHGFLLTIAAGGTLTELLKDRQSLLVPASPEMIGNALDALRIAPLLNGYRGAPAASRSAIVSAIMAVQDYVIANADGLAEVEVNPLLCGPDFAIAADALISREDAHV